MDRGCPMMVVLLAGLAVAWIFTLVLEVAVPAPEAAPAEVVECYKQGGGEWWCGE